MSNFINPNDQVLYSILSFALHCRLINGLKGQGTKLPEARFLFYGAGSSAVGVAELLMLLLQKEGGLSPQEARKVRQFADDFRIQEKIQTCF